MVDSLLGADVGRFPSSLSLKLRTAEAGGSLVRTSRATCDFDVLRIMLTPVRSQRGSQSYGGKNLFHSVIGVDLHKAGTGGHEGADRERAEIGEVVER